jgi:hypothetical protein
MMLQYQIQSEDRPIDFIVTEKFIGVVLDSSLRCVHFLNVCVVSTNIYNYLKNLWDYFFPSNYISMRGWILLIQFN